MITPVQFLSFVINALSLFVTSGLWSFLLIIFALALLSALIYVIFVIIDVR